MNITKGEWYWYCRTCQTNFGAVKEGTPANAKYGLCAKCGNDTVRQRSGILLNRIFSVQALNKAEGGK